MSKAVKALPDPVVRLHEEFVNLTHDKLKELFPGVKPAGREDKRSFSKSYETKLKKPIAENDGKIEFESDPPKVIQGILVYVNSCWKMPLDSTCTVTVNYCMRRSQMIIDPPKNNVVCRIILNYGYDETYYMKRNEKSSTEAATETVSTPPSTPVDISSPESPSDTLTPPTEKSKMEKLVDKLFSDLPDQRKLLVHAGSAIILGPKMVSNYEIKVPADPHVKFPDFSDKIAKNINGIPGYRENGRSGTIRPGTYNRITIILDYQTSINLAKGLDEASQKLSKNPEAIQGLIKQIGGGNLLNGLGNIIPKLSENLDEDKDKDKDKNNGKEESKDDEKILTDRTTKPKKKPNKNKNKKKNKNKNKQATLVTNKSQRNNNNNNNEEKPEEEPEEPEEVENEELLNAMDSMKVDESKKDEKLLNPNHDEVDDTDIENAIDQIKNENFN